MTEAGASLAALVRAAAAAAPDAPAVVAGDQRLTWARARRRGRPGRRRVRRARAARRVTGSPSSCPTASPGCARPSARCGPGWSSSRSTPPTPIPSSSTCSATPAPSLLVAAADRAPVGGVRVCAGPPDGDGPPPEVPEDPAAPAFLCLHERHDRPPARRDPHRGRAAGQPGAVPGDDARRSVRADDRVLLVLPLFHVYGLNAGFGLVAATGACAVLQETFDPRGSLALMAEEQVTAVPGAPPMYQAWLAAADAAGSDAELRRGFAAMRMASSGAAPLPEEVWTAMRDRAAVTVWEGYGLTEASPVVASTLATGRAKPNCIGGPVPGVELELRDTADHRSPASTSRADEDHLEGPGEIWVRGPNLFAGYWPDGADGPGRRRLAGHRRPRLPRRRRRPAPGRPAQRPDPGQRLQRLPGRGGAGARRPPGGRRERRHRRARPAHRVRRPGGRRPGARGQDVTFEAAAGVRRAVPGPVQGADVGALPAVAAALADREGQPGAAARARADRRPSTAEAEVAAGG